MADVPALSWDVAQGETCVCGLLPRLFVMPLYRGPGTAVSCPCAVGPLYFVLSFARHLRYKGDKRRAHPWTVPCTPLGEVEGQP